MTMHINEEYIPILGKKLWTKKVNIQPNLDKPTLVFLHDALGSISQWKEFPINLAKHLNLNVFYYDRIGHGLSEKKDKKLNKHFFEKEAVILHILLSKVKINNYIFYGHSDGGTIALLYTSDPALPKPKAIILEAAHVLNEEITIKGIIKTEKQADKLIPKLEKYHSNKSKTLFRNWFELWTSNEMENWNIESQIYPIDIPTLIIQGKQDNYGSLKQVEKITKSISAKNKTVLIDNCGHTPHSEQQETVLNSVKSFVKSINFL